MKVFTLAAVKKVATVISGMESQNTSLNLEQVLASGSGAVENSFVTIAEIRPELTFSSTEVKAALNAFGGINGLALAGTEEFYFQKRKSGGIRDTAGHVKATAAAAGIIIPVSLKVNHKGKATIDYRVVFASVDGAAAPLAIVTSTTLPTGQDVISDLYTLGPVSINGVALNGVQSVNIDFGIDLTIMGGDGNVYPTFVGITKRQPKISISTTEVDQLFDSNLGLTGAVQGITDSTIALTDYVEGGGRGAAPITFAVDEGMIHLDNASANDGSTGEASVIITPTWDGTADVIAITGL